MKNLFLLCSALQLSRLAWAQTTPLPIVPLLPEVVPASAPIPDNEPPTDYLGAIWVPAATGNFDPQNRPLSEPIDMVIVHDIEGPVSSAIRIFQDPKREVSAHYIVGGDGRVWQMLREHNVGWHAGNRNINHRSIGIETEGYAYQPGWYNSQTYEAEAKLVRDITRRYGIPRDRTHIIGHSEVPNPKDPTKFGGVSGHTDPGPYWNWAAFMILVRNDARLAKAQIPATIRPGETLGASLTFQNSGDDKWPANTASDTKEALQASGPLVVLGTEAGRISPLFNLQGWLSPTLAAGASSDTLPGESARFEFTLRGPRELGVWSDQLRLTTMPTAAQGALPISFGEKVTVAMRVVPWVLDVSSTASEKSSSAKPILAQWKVALSIGGIYAVYAAPPKPAKTRRQKRFSYRIGTLTGDKIVEAKPEDGGKGWLFAGYFRFPEPSKEAPTVSAQLISAPRGVNESNAGALRFIGPFPAASNRAPDPSQIPGAPGDSNR
ncbi:N-acetylmuramoyl-L-alanine amidase [Abditibacterium utsteinense]|uniref:N-acetylmuramoyl-L-alanine amidase n=1 Tax=Abditibacterium utsteinense TaxID=1960156 RepID=A0A2S8SRE4_9BACT|nr:peptidoglycan recognition family protein [Abditibacterium utsteinense]PQV63319.1 N-acetylmuramoyl-L-alanine amidase [Abditibacterium utsteinense]